MMHRAGGDRFGDAVELVTVGSASTADIVAAGHGAVALIARSPARVGAEVFDALGELAVVSATGSGADCIDIEAATERGIPVLHNPGVAPIAVSEYVIAAILTLRKHLHTADAYLRSGGGWEPKDRFVGSQVAGSTLGIVGFGHIGRDLARRARLGLGMRVVGYDPGKSAELFAAHEVTPLDLDSLLGESDVVSLHTPLREATRGLIGSRELGLFKPSGLLINTARGPVVDEAALVQALLSGRIAGAAVDVFDPEPPAPDHPLFDRPNVLVTPHLAGLTEESLARLSAAVAGNVLLALRGERPPHVLNPSAWPPRRSLPIYPP